ncbi:hypothetical protein GOP47_0020267 [Adiantum capillus-veneris]|uniref:C2H2-type domain-containing protein n=1 Tax=Adiantum capillus-veneris TaxID=13818 RepID=A0A9D4Z9E0_ADICA|nr:hypothetical protein GOP47_0019663 [Adiantum capillus-veneris]KAI5065572.1 hypothetical protein GOP47_0020267 [Adiantum capillus-veneris]
MEQTLPSGSKDADTNYHMFGNNQLQGSTSNPQQSMPFFQRSFPVGTSQYRPWSHFHPLAAYPFEGDGCNRHTPTYIRNLPHSTSSYRTHLPAGIVNDTSHVPNFQAAPSWNSPEGLLEIILSSQQKLQQLQAVVELMVQVGGQGQEHHSLVAGVKLIMSQLFAATACLRQQPPDLVPDFSQASEGIDLRFDNFYDNGMNNSIPAVGHETLKLVNMRGAEALAMPLLNASEPQPQAMEPVLIKSMEISKPPGEMDSRFKEQHSDDLFCDPSNQRSHGNTIAKLIEFDSSNESSRMSSVKNRNQEAEDHEFPNVSRDDDDDGESENLPPGSYELVEMAAAEILAEHTHFCEICGKGFKRDANLRMHMRGHGDEYKTPAALARPDKSSGFLALGKPRRYSCPFLGCKRNKQHRKFQPLKTTLCVKNHYRRSHCPKMLTCSKCKVKKFSVVADLKTHEKHCGQDKWQCSCGTTFSRKDKLTGHVNLFSGHAPMVSCHETENFNNQGEPSSNSLTSESMEGLECLGGSNINPSALPRSGLATFDISDNETSITDLIALSDEVFRGDESKQQASVLLGEESFLLDNSRRRDAVEVLQNCG